MEDALFDSWVPNLKSALYTGLIVGLIFGAVNVVFSWLFPLQDDTIGALLRFYGPMFFVWGFASFQATRRKGRFSSGVATGVVVAFATFCVFDLLNLIRVNLFLDQLTRGLAKHDGTVSGE